MTPARPDHFLTAEEAGLVGCRRCGRVWPQDQRDCGRCGAKLVRPSRRSLHAVWAWLIAGFILYIPANLFPMLRTDWFIYGSYANTIVGGVIEFFQYGDHFVAIVILVASVGIPIAKFLVIGYLAWEVGQGRHVSGGASQRMRLYEIVEFIGRWSMIDVFVVAILTALVQLGFLLSIHPGPAAAAFALSVAFTMLAAQSFDSRLVWMGDAEVPRTDTGPVQAPNTGAEQT